MGVKGLKDNKQRQSNIMGYAAKLGRKEAWIAEV